MAALSGLRPIERHRALLRLGYKSDADALASAHRFLWPEVEQPRQPHDRAPHSHPTRWGDRADPEQGLSWEVRLARRYYEKLHREYALADLTRYKEGAVGLVRRRYV